ncbi:MAG: signal peptidase I [Bacilli bacterium]
MNPKRKKFIEKFINILLNILIIIFGIILLISIYIGIQTKILGHAYPNFFGYSIFEVQTGSMADTINPGDWSIIKLGEKVELNDIITYEVKGEYITHRIIEVYSNSYVTKGDANSAKDVPIKQNQIVGKVVKVLPNFGLIRKILFNPAVLISLIITLFMLNIAIKKDENDKIRLFLCNLIKKMKKLIKFNKSKEVTVDNNYDNEPTEDDLDNTVFYRVIPVDASELKSNKKHHLSFGTLIKKIKKIKRHKKVKQNIEKKDLAEIKIKKIESMEDINNDNLNSSENRINTIPVDASELDNTLLEIAQNEMSNSEQQEKIKEKEEKKKELEEKQKTELEEKVEEDKSLTSINLDLLKNKKGYKKGKNIIDTVMLIKKEELYELVDLLIKEDKKQFAKIKIKDVFITAYIDVKYYNYYSDMKEYRNKKLASKIKGTMKEAVLNSEVMKSYLDKDNEYSEIEDLYTKIVLLIANIEQAKTIDASKAKHEFYKKEIKKYAKEWDNKKLENVIDEITKIQKSYSDTTEYFLKNLETNIFDLNFNKLVTKKDMYGLDLEHNISFSRVYSDYIIDKTYSEGIIAEDKMTVLLTLLSVQLVKDIMTSDFNKKYILYIPKSLYGKERKLEKILKLVDNKYAKESIIILLLYEDLVSNNETIKELRQTGYKFALIFDKEISVEKSNLYIVDYIFVGKKDINKTELRSYIPDELLGNVIYEDIITKVGDFGGEEL